MTLSASGKLYLDLRNHGYDISNNADVVNWYRELKTYLIHLRSWRSDLTGKIIQGGIDCHHGIVLRSTISRSIWWHPLIHAEINLFLLSREEHMNPPSKQQCWDMACERFGGDVVQEWYFGLPWKTGRPPQLF